MSLIISENGTNAQRLSPSGFDREDFLQQYIAANPDAIPVYEIDEDIRLLVLAREFSTNSGPIDALGIDQHGNIYLIETKLFKNPDKRTVVAQVLDYGASLWSSSIDFADFTAQLDKHTAKQFNLPLAEKLKEYFALEDADVDAMLGRIQGNLNNGSFKFVVLMDSLHRRLKDLIIFMNRNSQFDIYAVELEYYKHQTFEIIIPRMFGTEVKKEVISTKAPAGGRRTWSEDSYFQEVATNLTPGQSQALRKLYEWAKQNATEVRWGTGVSRGSFSPIFESVWTRSFMSVFTDGSVQINYGFYTEAPELKARLATSLRNHIEVAGVTDLSEAELTSLPAIPVEYLEQNVDKIIGAFTEFIAQ